MWMLEHLGMFVLTLLRIPPPRIDGLVGEDLGCGGGLGAVTSEALIISIMR